MLSTKLLYLVSMTGIPSYLTYTIARLCENHHKVLFIIDHKLVKSRNNKQGHKNEIFRI